MPRLQVTPDIHAETSRIYAMLRDRLMDSPPGSLPVMAVLIALEALTVVVIRGALEQDVEVGQTLAAAHVGSLAEMVERAIAEAQLPTSPVRQVH